MKIDKDNKIGLIVTSITVTIALIAIIIMLIMDKGA